MTPEEFHRQLLPEICKKEFDKLKELGLIRELDYKFAEEYHKEQLILTNVVHCKCNVQDIRYKAGKTIRPYCHQCGQNE